MQGSMIPRLASMPALQKGPFPLKAEMKGVYLTENTLSRSLGLGEAGENATFPLPSFLFSSLALFLPPSSLLSFLPLLLLCAFLRERLSSPWILM